MALTISHLLDFLREAQVLSPSQWDETQSLQQQFSTPESLASEMAKRGWLTAFQARHLIRGRTRELLLGPYLLLDRLGKGGYSQIFKARHLKMDRMVAIKAIRPEMLKDSDAVQRFHREIEVASQLSHPNIVHAFEAAKFGPALVLVMEFVDGRDLDQMVQQSGPLSCAQAADYIRQAAVGLEYAREQGLVHRDIKPSNLLVTADPASGNGMVKILDLGLARMQHPAETSRTRNLTVLGSSSVMQGSPDFMSPEQAIDFHTADIRSDVYSLGCTYFYLMAGEPPFAGGSLTEKLMKHHQTPPTFEKIPSLLPELQTVLEKMLAKKPDDRYQTPGEIAEVLQPFCVPAAVPTYTDIGKDTLPGLALRTTQLTRRLFQLRKTDAKAEEPASSKWRRRLVFLLALLLIPAALIWFWPFSAADTLPGPRTQAQPAGPLAQADRMLLAHWKLNEGKGNQALDGTGHGHVGQLMKGTSWRPVLSGGGLHFDGKDDFVSIAIDEPETDVSHALWFRTTTDNVALFSVVNKDLGVSGHDRHLHLYRGNLRARIHSGGVIVTKDLKLMDGKWHHVVHVFGKAAEGQKLYVDGVERAAGKKAKSDFNWQKRINIGFSNDAQRKYFLGDIADVRIYKKVLTPDEIKALSTPNPLWGILR